MEKEIETLNNLEFIKAAYEKHGGFDDTIKIIEQSICALLEKLGDKVSASDDCVVLKVKRFKEDERC